MIDKNLYELKIRLKLVEAEAKLLRKAEKKYSNNEKDRNHFYLLRARDARFRARHLHLVYAFLREMPYSKVENNPRRKPDLATVRNLARHYNSFKWTKEMEESLLSWWSNK